MREPELCPGRIGTAANHCWHDTGVALMSYPAKTEQVCCFCNTRRHLELMAMVSVFGQHGPHVPPNT